MNRAMLVTVLWRLDGRPAPQGENTFTDVAPRRYYTDAVIWANACGIVEGTHAGVFEPESNVTREQIAAIIYRYARYKGYDLSSSADLSAFPDAASVSRYARDSLSWAKAEGVISGLKAPAGVTLLDPKGDATRSQVAAILMRFLYNVVGTE